MSKKLEKWTHEELVDDVCRIIIQELCNGKLRTGVVRAIQLVLNWRDTQK